MRRSRRFGLFLGAILSLASTGCEPHSSWLRRKDEDELPPRKSGVAAVNSDTSKILGVDSDDKTTPSSFFKTDRRTGGWSSEAQEIERNLGDSAELGPDAMTAIVHALWNRLLGDRGERVAARFLRRQGMRVLTRGYPTHHGEIDLIARDGDTLVFVEVKARRQGMPAEAVIPEKQRRIALAAQHFLREHRLLEQQCRFDIVAIVWPDDRPEPQIEHIRNAFEAVGRGQMFR